MTSQYVPFVELSKLLNRKLIAHQIDIANYVKTTLTSISRSNDENVDVSLYRLLEPGYTFQYIKSCVDILKIDCLRGLLRFWGFFGLTLILRSRDDLGGQFLHFSKLFRLVISLGKKYTRIAPHLRFF